MAALLVAVTALAFAARHPRCTAVVALPALLLCAWAGTTLPDIDGPLPLDHRSGLTHSALPAALALARRWAWPAAAGLAIGLAFHLAADFFPNAMTGYATVKLPIAGSIGAAASYWWIGVNAVLCGAAGGWLAGRVLTGGVRVAALSAAGAIGFVYLAGVDGGWWALTALMLLAAAALRLRSA